MTFTTDRKPTRFDLKAKYNKSVVEISVKDYFVIRVFFLQTHENNNRHRVSSTQNNNIVLYSKCIFHVQKTNDDTKNICLEKNFVFFKKILKNQSIDHQHAQWAKTIRTIIVFSQICFN